MIYGIEGGGQDVEEICKFQNGQRAMAEQWASGERYDGENFLADPGPRRIFQGPRGWRLPASRPASNPLAHPAKVIERECVPIKAS